MIREIDTICKNKLGIIIPRRCGIFRKKMLILRLLKVIRYFSMLIIYEAILVCKFSASITRPVLS